jgi:hypothetical protein
MSGFSERARIKMAANDISLSNARLISESLGVPLDEPWVIEKFAPPVTVQVNGATATFPSVQDVFTVAYGLGQRSVGPISFDTQETP